MVATTALCALLFQFEFEQLFSGRLYYAQPSCVTSGLNKMSNSWLEKRGPISGWCLLYQILGT